MSESKPIEDKLLDKRTIDRRLARGTLSRADFEARLQALPDLAEAAEDIASRVYGTLGAPAATDAEG